MHARARACGRACRRAGAYAYAGASAYAWAHAQAGACMRMRINILYYILYIDAGAVARTMGGRRRGGGERLGGVARVRAGAIRRRKRGLQGTKAFGSVYLSTAGQKRRSGRIWASGGVSGKNAKKLKKIEKTQKNS